MHKDHSYALFGIVTMLALALTWVGLAGSVVAAPAAADSSAGELLTIDDIPVRSLPVASSDGRLAIGVELATDVGRDVGELKGRRGGRNLTINGFTVCTGGFISRRSGEEGLITAKHCANNLDYQASNVLTFVASASDTSSGGTVDIQFHRFDSGDVDPFFRATGRADKDDRAVNAVANAPEGSAVCAWGDQGGYDCTQVMLTDVCRDGFGDGVNRCGLDRASSEITVPGDSGGPWFFGNTARGTLTGAINGRDYFTRIGRATANLDATVLQN